MSTEIELREAVAAVSRRLHERGWVANHDGNVTVRFGEDRVLATPGARSKADVTAIDLLVVDLSGAVVSAPAGGKPFSELGLHLAAYAERPDVRAVVHAHPPAATAFACAGRPLPQPMIAEAVVSLGAAVPLVPFAPPGPDACAALRAWLRTADAFLLEQHGTLAVGADLEQAYLRTELCEHLAHIALAALPLGGVRPLPDAVLPALLESRRKAGLGAYSGAEAAPFAAAPTKISVLATVVACGPAPAGAMVQTRQPGADGRDGLDLAALIREEILGLLREPQ